jgi:hypothetical protein
MVFFIRKPKIFDIVNGLIVKKSAIEVLFCNYCTSFLSTFYFLFEISVKLPSLNVKIRLNSYKNRKAICQKQLHQSHFCWSWDSLHAPIQQHLQQARLQSQHQFQLSQFHKNCQPNKNRILLRIFSAPPLISCGGA